LSEAGRLELDRGEEKRKMGLGLGRRGRAKRKGRETMWAKQ